MRKHTCMHALCANIHKAHTRIQYVCVNECWPGVPLGGNYSARRGSILTASCFLSLSLSLCGHWLHPWRTWLPYYHTQHVCVCVVMCPCMYVCFPLHLTVLSLACLTHSQLGALMFMCLPVCRCVFAGVPALCPSVCVLPLVCLTPHLLVSSQRAFHWAVTQCATALPLNWTGLWG